MEIRRGTREELEGIRALLEASGLPVLPLHTPLANILVALEDGKLVGAAALEVISRRGLTLALAVSDEHREDGLGTSLLRSLVSRAQELGLRELYAVAGASAAHFAPLGFQPVAPDAVPGEIRGARSYRALEREGHPVLRLELATRL